ncbi:PREDICTED: serine/threonine-protein kinase D6PK-like [Ipomoea nil]|uniref:serine/threonine-protein kinase D6PK-like n=1 Tax=Ipomoea nil TaxID=35883 RepID=UPI000900E22D|nr:PREDICTED: serine/threonine-protein kinase D6PK-like [Ipomoea nil]
MEPSVDDKAEAADDVQSVISFSSTADINRTTSSASTLNCTTSNASEATSSDSFASHLLSPNSTDNPARDPCWIAIRALSSSLSLSDLCVLKRLGAGDMGAVYLVKLKKPEPSVSSALFAAKIIDRKEIECRSKEGRLRTEREILEILDHPFVPTLYATIDSPNWSCLLMEYCPGGDLHVLRQRQHARRFNELAVRFYASEVVAALEYIHMLGIVYRDLKPENVLVRSDGHIMLTDFDLSLKCDECTSTTATVVTGEIPPDASPQSDFCNNPPKLPNCMAPAVSCFRLYCKRKKNRRPHSGSHRAAPRMVAEPVDVRSMSFVGTHEYLAPEVVSGEGHGNAVDWWTLGIFIFELFYGVTPFKGVDHDHTWTNIVIRALEFPKEPAVPAAAKDLISKLLIKDPASRLGSTMGATAVKNHGFFQSVNWALLRRKSPPFIPPPLNPQDLSKESYPDIPVEFY